MNDQDREAFVQFVHASSARLTRLAVLLIAERQGADDLVQVAYERTLRHWPRLQREGNPELYARRILVNLAIDNSRSRTRRPEVLSQPPDESINDCAEIVGERMRILNALAKLPKQQRAVVVLRYYADLSEAAIAETLDCSVGTVKSNAHRATAKLRELLSDPHDFSESVAVPS